MLLLIVRVVNGLSARIARGLTGATERAIAAVADVMGQTQKTGSPILDPQLRVET
jgi:hypothetical protein